MAKEEWRDMICAGHWNFGGARTRRGICAVLPGRVAWTINKKCLLLLEILFSSPLYWQWEQTSLAAKKLGRGIADWDMKSDQECLCGR